MTTRKWFKSENPELYDHFEKKNIFEVDGYADNGEPINRRPMFPESVTFFAALEPWERHCTVPVASIVAWKAELPLHKGTSYGQILARDIRLAEECNLKGDEMIVSFRQFDNGIG